ncbi:MAG: hypothetical protein AAF378_10220 [Cyanobacteria bacterium P01_A01_bin.84]
MRFLLSSAMIGLGLLPVTVQAQQPFKTQVAAIVEALRLAAPNTGSENDGLYSQWQVKPETFRSWSKYCLKKEVPPIQFEKDPQLARQVISCIMERELKQQLEATNNQTEAVSRTACWWMTGTYTCCNNGFTADYVKKVLEYYQKQASQTESSTN